MSVSTTMKSMGKTARDKVESTAHEVKDRSIERRLDRSQAETDRLRHENDLLRDEVTESRSEHRRILELIEERFAELSDDVEEAGETKTKKSHKFRWFLFLLAIGGGVYYWFKQRTGGDDEWDSQMPPAVTQTGTSTTL